MPLNGTGLYVKDPQPANALFNVGLAKPSIYNKLTKQDWKYNLSYIPHAMSSVSSLPIGQPQDTWFIEGRNTNSKVATGTATGTGVGNTVFYVEYTDNSLNPKDVVQFKSGVQAAILDGGTPTALGFTYAHRLHTTSATAAIVSTDYAAGQPVGYGGWSSFENKSKTGYGGVKYPDRYTNWTSTHRRACSLDRSSYSTLSWIYNEAGKPMVWFPKQYMQEMNEYKYGKEMKYFYAKNNMSINGICMTPDIDGNMLPQGAGYREQVDGMNVDSYSGQLTAAQLVDYIYAYVDNACIAPGSTILAVTGTQGSKQWQNALELKYQSTGTMRQAIIGGKPVDLGNTYPSWTIGNVKLLLVVNPIKDDKQFNVSYNSNGFAKEANSFDFINLDNDGEANLVRKVRSAGGVDAAFIEKQIPGMFNPMSEQTVTSNSIDAFEVQWLCEDMLEVLNPKSCGILYQN